MPPRQWLFLEDRRSWKRISCAGSTGRWQSTATATGRWKWARSIALETWAWSTGLRPCSGARDLRTSFDDVQLHPEFRGTSPLPSSLKPTIELLTCINDQFTFLEISSKFFLFPKVERMARKKFLWTGKSVQGGSLLQPAFHLRKPVSSYHGNNGILFELHQSWFSWKTFREESRAENSSCRWEQTIITITFTVWIFEAVHLWAFLVVSS